MNTEVATSLAGFLGTIRVVAPKMVAHELPNCATLPKLVEGANDVISSMIRLDRLIPLDDFINRDWLVATLV